MTAENITTSTEPLPPAPPAPTTKTAPRKGGLRPAYSVGLTALLSWGAGNAGQSWHLSVPFLAGWLVLLGVVLLSDHLTGVVGAAWHREKINATPQLVAISKGAELAVESIAKRYLASQGINL